MATLDQLAGSGAAGIIIAAPFILIVLLHRACALWRDWTATRTYAAHHVRALAAAPRLGMAGREAVAALAAKRHGVGDVSGLLSAAEHEARQRLR